MHGSCDTARAAADQAKRWRLISTSKSHARRLLTLLHRIETPRPMSSCALANMSLQRGQHNQTACTWPPLQMSLPLMWQIRIALLVHPACLISCGFLTLAELWPTRTSNSFARAAVLSLSSFSSTRPCMTMSAPAAARPRIMPNPMPCVDPAGMSKHLLITAYAQCLTCCT